jgi:hypothetical protein
VKFNDYLRHYYYIRLQVMERAGFRGIVMDAVQASAERATELGKRGS